MTERTKNRRYHIELGGALVLYAAVLVISLKMGQGLAPGALQTAILVTPMVPMLFGVWAIARHLRRVDEFLRQQTLEHLAIVAAATAGWTFTYGFLENAGFPRLSMFIVWPVMGAVWGGLQVLGNLRSRLAP